MILDESVKLNIRGKNLKYYRDLGYNISYNDNLEVLINDLPKNSGIKINVKCDICGKEKRISYQDYNIKLDLYGSYMCSLRNELKKDYNILTSEEEIEVIEMSKRGYKVKDIMSKFNISSRSQFRRILKRNGDSKINGNRFNTNHFFFENIDSENKAYWLGFLYADGCVRKRKFSGNIELTLSRIDREHIEKFILDTNSNYEIKDSFTKLTYKGETKKHQISSLSITSEKMYQDLVRHGCTERKTFSIKPPIIDDEYVNHFIRGYFDGDGCICNYIKNGRDYTKISILGTIELLNWFNLKLSENGLSFRNILPKGNIYKLEYNRVRDKKLFFDYVYKNSKVYLKRKYLKFKTNLT